MIIRIVKMTFRPEETDQFLSVFKANKKRIRNFPGVDKLELLRDENNPAIFFTYSIWKDQHHLETYRRSALFKDVWTQTRSLFAEKAEAWSVDRLTSL